ncbi:MAG: two component regulator propeller [Schlesneria sp.]|nr:two component regulator propeller [Schlesneria sp.]
MMGSQINLSSSAICLQLICGGLFALSGCGSKPLPPPPSTSHKVISIQAEQPSSGRISASIQPTPSTKSPTDAAAIQTDPTSPSSISAIERVTPERSTKSAQPEASGRSIAGPEAAGLFVMALCEDLDGNIWVGTEENGVIRRTPKGEWTQFTSKDGLGDDYCYALCCDRLGRIWVGHLNHGVTVFNGKTWKNYDVLDGPLGERIFDIACNPTDGDVWMATSAGLSCYSEPSQGIGRWTHLNRADGLPSDQANALAFDTNGDLHVGTQCDGLAIGRCEDRYASWQVVTGNKAADAKYRQPQGTGLPSSQINDVLVSQDGTIYVATSLGLAKSKNRGQTWEYLRGRDYAEKVKGRLETPPKTWSAPPQEKLAALLPEDYVNCLAEDAQGRLWVGFRQQGLVVADPKTKQTNHAPPGKDGLKNDFVTAILPAASGLAWCAGQGNGLEQVSDKVIPQQLKEKAQDEVTADPRDRMHPMRAAQIGATDLLRLRRELKPENQPVLRSKVTVLPDDWRTQGTWVDRYGNFGAVLCAMGGGGVDYIVGEHAPYMSSRGWIGRNYKERGDQLRYWVHWIKTNDLRSLQNPLMGGRKQSEWDDHAEVYPMSLDGPHVYGTVRLPRGKYCLSLYIMNKDGHSGANRLRDFLVEVRPTPMSWEKFDWLGKPGNEAETIFERSSGATSRVRSFWGGVYKRFYIEVADEKEYFTVRINRNHSFNTILSAIFIDPAGTPCGRLGPYDEPPQWDPRFVVKPGPTYGDTTTNSTAELLNRLMLFRDTHPEWYLTHGNKHLTELLRLILREPETGGSCLGFQFARGGREEITKGDICALLSDARLFAVRDDVSDRPLGPRGFAWRQRTNGNPKWSWSHEEYDKFNAQRHSKW